MQLHLDSVIDRTGFGRLPRLLSREPGDGRDVLLGKRALALLLVLALVGLSAAVVAFFKGHHVMGTTSEMPWGILIATYVFFVVSSTGLGLMSSLGHVFGFKVFDAIARRALFLALVMLVVGFSVIATELERPFLLLKLVILSPNPAAPIWWMGTLYGIYLVVIALELYFLLVDNHVWSKRLAIGVVVAALTIHPTSNLGGVFGLSHSRPFWWGPLLPVYLMASALVCGAALLLLVVYAEDFFGNGRQLRPENAPLVDALRRLLALFIGITVMLSVWRFVSALQGAHYHRSEVAVAMLSGPLFVSFWLFEIFFGVLVPLYLLLLDGARSPGRLAFAAGSTMVGVFVSRIDLVYAGQMFSLKPLVGHMGEVMRYQPPFKGHSTGFLAYTPSIVEELIVVGAVAAAVLLYVGGARVLRVSGGSR